MTAQLLPEQHRTRIAGVEIAWLAWGEPNTPTVLLVHGGAANARWWSRLAPTLADSFRVLAVDLSGHGDSGWRPEYRFAEWVREVLAVGELPMTLVGHSLGGIVATLATAAEPTAVRHLVLVDSPVRRPDPVATGDADTTFALARTYATRDAALARFRPLPAQPVSDPAFLREVAEHSVRADGTDWAWKFDSRVFAGDGPPDRPADLEPLLARARCPVTAIVGEHSVVVPEAERSTFRRLADYQEISGGHHHLMFDSPDELERRVGRAVRYAADPAS